MIINKKILLYSLLAGLAFGASRSWPMEAEKDISDTPFDSALFSTLPKVLKCKIIRMANPDEMPLKWNGGLQDIRTSVINYNGLSGDGFVDQSPSNSQCYAFAQNDSVKIYTSISNIEQLLSSAPISEYQHIGASAVCFSPDGQHVISAGKNGKIKKATLGGSVIEELTTSDNKDVRTICCSHSSGYIGCCSELDFKTKIFKLDGTTIGEYKSDITAACFSPDNQYIASGGFDGMLIIAKLDGTKVFNGRVAHQIDSIQFSPEGNRIFIEDHNFHLRINNTSLRHEKNILPLLLAQHKLTHPTFSKYHLQKRVQESLLTKKEPLVVGCADYNTLEEMPKLKELLHIEDNTETKDATAKLWRLQLKIPSPSEPTTDEPDTRD